MPNNPANYFVGGNDEHGINPPTPGKRTPVMPYIDRPIYENEFNYPAKNFFLEAMLRCGFFVFDVKPERQDISINMRVTRINAQRLSGLASFAYNSYGDGLTFNTAKGAIQFYSLRNPTVLRSRTLSQNVYDSVYPAVNQAAGTTGHGVQTLDVGVLSSVNCPSTLLEAGFMTNFNEAKLMLDPDYQQVCGEATAKGCTVFFDTIYKKPYTSPDLPLLKRGSTGNTTKFMQYRLIQTGYPSGGVDGIFGSGTEAGVKAFQSDNGLTADGIVGKNTWTKLLLLNIPSQLLKKGSKGAYVNYMQKKLLAKLYPLTVDNDFGPKTEAAVKAFQSENGLTADGIVGKNTWAKLMVIGGGRGLT